MAWALALACGGGPGGADGGGEPDALDPGTADGSVDAGCGLTAPAPGCACARDGDISCAASAGLGYRCAGGAWTMFADGECWGRGGTGVLDAGVHDDTGGVAPCEADPTTPGCPCACEQERICALGLVSRHCIERTWRAGWNECTAGPTCADAGLASAP